jgi:hypothetical protein
VTITYAAGPVCTGTPETFTITVNPKHTITASAGSNGTISPSGSTDVCQGDNITYTMTATSGYHLDYVEVDNAPVTVTNNAYTFTNVTGSHSIEAFFALDCVQPATPTVSSDAPSNAICSGSSTTLTATGTLGDATAWQWYTTSCVGGTSAGSGAALSVSPTTTTTYYVRGEGGCTTPGACASVTITVKTTPSVSVTINPPSGSAAVGNVPANPLNPTTPYLMFIGYGAQTVNLTASASGGSGLTYAWSEPGSNTVSHLSSATATNPSFNPANTQGSFTRIVTVTNSVGCTASRSVEMCVRDIRVPGTVPKGSYPKVHMCSGGTTAAQVPTNQVLSFQNSGYVLGQCNMTACNSSNLTQMRSIAGRDGEEGMSEVVEAVAELGMAVYPNPSNSQFTLRISSTTADKADVRVLDLSGRVVERLPATPTNTEVQLGRELSPGVYFVEVRSGEEVKMTKVVKL